MKRLYFLVSTLAVLALLQSIVPVYSAESDQSAGNNSYQFEINGAYLNNEDDDNAEMTQYNVTASYYFSPVSTGSYPLAEVAFLEHAGRMMAEGSIIKMSIGEYDADGNGFSVLAEYVFPEIPVYLGADYTNIRVEYGSPFDGYMKGNSIEGRIGYYILQGLFAGFSYERDKIETSISMDGYPSYESKSNTDTFQGNIKYVYEFAGGSAVNFESLYARSSEKDDSEGEETGGIKYSSIGIKADYYINPKISIGAGCTVVSGDDKNIEGKTLGVRFKAFILPQLAIMCSFAKFSADNSEGVDEDQMEFGLMFRI